MGLQLSPPSSSSLSSTDIETIRGQTMTLAQLIQEVAIIIGSLVEYVSLIVGN